MDSANGTKTLVRSRGNRVVAGVCGGLAEYFGVDLTLIRLLVAVIAVMTGGVVALAYLAAWLIIPEQGETISIAENLVSKNQHSPSG
jgi:phage shock protein PspC (stress-responsive transcriptional regulator)